VAGRSVARAELASALDDDLYRLALPGQERRLTDGADRNLASVDEQEVAVQSDIQVEPTEGAVPAQQVPQRLGVGDVVDGDDLEVVALRGASQVGAADAAKSVDANPDAHLVPLVVAPLRRLFLQTR
jgi:hypothetical protein